MFDAFEFLQQPITLRKCVYWHLNSQLIDLKPPATHELFTSTFTSKKKTSRKSKSLRGLQKKLRRFVELYSYMPEFVDSWLEYMTYLRFDCIVLDYLRVNRELESQLTQLHWIFISGELKLGLFSPDGLLQFWCSLEEYQTLIDNDLNLSTVLDLEHINEKELKALDAQLESMERKDWVHQVKFYHDEETVEKSQILALIGMLDSLKSLQTIAVTNESMFERVVNFHGFRDHPGHTIGYAVKRRVATLELSRCGSLGLGKAVANLSRWEAVGKVTFAFLEELDMNQVILPPRCVWLRFYKIKKLKWWSAEELRSRLPGSCLRSDTLDQILEAGIKNIAKHMDSSELYKCKALLWDILRHIHRVQLIDVRDIEPVPILPMCLYNSGQVQCSGTSKADQVIFL
ncbi:LAFA_0F09516g1_1 [Lachancea sp. 'fantastica']|nr:LAFA_0F09516g1_1 [Lachancea sp. 'fantastica']